MLVVKSFVATRISRIALSMFLVSSGATACAAEHAGPQKIQDQYVKRADSLAPDRTPPDPAPSSYGLDPKTGVFKHPSATRDSHDPHPFKGTLDYWDPNTYARNVEVIAYYPWVVEPFHTWQNIVDFDGRRYLYQYVRRDLKVYDITDPRDVKLLMTRGSTWGPNGPTQEVDPMPEDEMFGAAVVQWNEKRQAYIMVQAYEVRRFGLLKDKRRQPDKVEAIRKAPHLKGFKVFQMNGPLPDDWELLAERTTDIEHPNAPIGEQQGSGVRDIPMWDGGKYMFVAAAPTADYALTEYPNDLYSAGYQSWDMSDPANPVFLDQLAVPGQIAFNSEHEAAYKKNSRAGNRTSWMGARMSLFVPKPVEKGGKYGYAAMGGLGFYIVDISDPSDMKVISHLNFPASVAGTEGDFIDVSQVEETGIVYYSGYPLNEDCWEPYKNIYRIDVSNPKQPKVLGVMPRPKPPAWADFTDFCQRRGSFGPKRTGSYTSPGAPKPGLLPFNFYNAGVQLFDVSNPEDPKIAGYFVPPFVTDRVVDYARGNLSHSVYVEYDRNIIWEFTNHGFYALSTPLLGEPVLTAPKQPWPPRR